MRAKRHSKSIFERKYCVNPHQAAATSLTTKAIYVVLAVAVLVFVAMLGLTMLKP
jgi:hypothetical protein